MFSFLRKKRRLKRDDIVALLADCVLKSGVTIKILESISPDERARLGPPSRLEAQALNLWVVNDALIRSAAELLDTQVHSLIDGYHFDACTHLALSGYTDADLSQLQSLIRIRYPEYSEAITPVLTGDAAAPLRLARMISGNLFKDQTSDLATAMTIAGQLVAALFAVNDLLRDALPRAEWP